ncbi:hypothetical protein GS429_15390 [Natronorubrum sp. JWXQ-INN-674]|uniref:Uncharacterized protein n=1 Tax=Natronorubrum halalkaliphilum TaxID=2691917 RepID=A0A6B0VSC9_9EURY|nr:hypothetical protein [Natronorubrum halalkaliphilum]MXV63419.1 hypothetical protein [Natronorubrum halalkaliphilum]
MVFEGFTTGSFIVIVFAISMVVVSIVSLADFALIAHDITKSYFGKVVMIGWILVGIWGVGMITLVTTETIVSVPLAFVGLLFTLCLLSYETILYSRSSLDDGVRPSVQWLLNRTNDNK